MRRSIALLACLAAAATVNAAGSPQPTRMIVFGVDGLDPVLLQEFMQEGRLPNFSALAKMGGFKPLGTSTPPQSPVAWSNFITGMDPGGHGIFDFIALDRSTLTPYMSTARTEEPSFGPLSIGDLRIPLAGAETLQLRDGTSFWEILETNDIPTAVFQIPANYPPVEAGGESVSGMGTPDLQGTPGTFTFYTNDEGFEAGPVSGGIIRRVKPDNGVIQAHLTGPPNSFYEEVEPSRAAFEVHVDKRNPVALIRIGEQEVLLNQGEWSEWLTVEFELVPGLVSIPGMVRFYLKQASPVFALYASPVNIDPRNPAQTISTPADHAAVLAEAAGPYYTQEMPEDTKALSAGVLDTREFLIQSEIVLEERRRLLKRKLEVFREQPRGLLFFYVGSVDQRHHMLARQMDPAHPYHEQPTPADLASAMRTTYEEIDELIGWLLAELDANTTLIVMSDHGFAPFRRQVNLNTWLEEQGYLELREPSRRDSYEWLEGIDWSATRAFAIGLNSLYLSVRGRERYGIVNPAERKALAAEIAARLHAWRDPASGDPVVTHAVLREDIYHGPHVEEAPDIVVGYARGYRASWATTSGKIPAGLIFDNNEEWSGDHCMDARAVPGVLLSSRPLNARDADLRDLTVSILQSFELEKSPQMQGDSIFLDVPD